MTSRRTVVILIALICWWTALVAMFPPHGFNYTIYTHNASLTLSGQQTFGRALQPEDGAYGASPYHPNYLDYSGAQHLIYVLLTAFGTTGWQLYSILLFALSAWLLWRITGQIAPAVLLGLHPAIWSGFLVRGYSDKLAWLALALAVVWLHRRGRFGWAAFLTGLSIPTNGLLLFFAPALVMRDRWPRWRETGLLVGGALLALLPFFPVAFLGWANRVAREGIVTPFWFAVWRLVPFYTPWLGMAVRIVLAGGATLLHWARRLRLEDVLIVAVLVVGMLSNHNGVRRAIPVVFLIVALLPRPTLYHWLALAVVMGVWVTTDGIGAADISRGDVLVFYVPVAWALVTYGWQRTRRRANAGITVRQHQGGTPTYNMPQGDAAGVPQAPDSTVTPETMIGNRPRKPGAPRHPKRSAYGRGNP